MPKLRAATVGRRFTILYATVFLASGTVLLTVAYLTAGGRLSSTEPSRQQAPPLDDLAAAQEHIRVLQDRLAVIDAEHSRQMLLGSIVALIGLTLVSVVLGRVLAGRVLRPLRRVTAATRRITAESLDRRLDTAGPTDEVTELAATINDLLQRLQDSFAAQRRFAANASHELRTPLATMRASLDVAVAKPNPTAQTVAVVDRLRAQLDQLDHLLDGLLVLARIQHGPLADRAPVDLRRLVADVLTDHATALSARGITVTQHAADVWASGSPALLTRMVQNVIDNSVRHNVDDGWVHVGLERTDGVARLSVETGGRLLRPAEVARLAEPFRRLGADRTGTDGGSGLGLSIVTAIAAAHGGRTDLTPRSEGGLRVVIMLPAESAPAVNR